MLYSATATIAAGSAIDTANRLEALRSHLTAPLQNLQYSVAFNASQAKVDEMRQTLLPQLMDESRKLAQSLATAAGVKLGAIRSISDSGGNSAVFLYATISQLVIFDSIFSGPLSGYPSALLPSSGTRYTFNLNVLFATAP
jgi:hypothetical protein